jgi:hypothetical protein
MHAVLADAVQVDEPEFMIVTGVRISGDNVV